MCGILSLPYRESATGVLQNSQLTIHCSGIRKKHKNPATAKMLSLELLKAFLREYIVDHSVAVSDNHHREQEQTLTSNPSEHATSTVTTTEYEPSKSAVNKRKTPPTTTPLTAAQQKSLKQELRLQSKRRKVANHKVYHHQLEDGFYGDLIALHYEDAIATAQHAHTLPLTEGKYHFHNFWVDASGCQGSAGAAIAYKDPQDGEEWRDLGYAISDLKGEKRVDMSELFAIGAALKLALARIGKRVAVAEGVEEHAVTVFSDSMSALGMIRRWANWWSQGEVDRSAFGAIAKDVCGLSRQLFDLGVKVRVYWVPAHCGVCIAGHKRADVLSKAAARYVKLLEQRDAMFSADGVQLVDSGFLKTLHLLADECDLV
ncbi:hypothetical protein ANOM_003601 [Aspergillus nomiae NRRL 13137]|uniref:RNase H type-1 domain-containing protein n=1 Tax=Aspergillus nomiae NRRL (strain ATCC 15546 / NRRL 13137 / CBS 260.88 / M93) TaxID=1509407 RepID=A0A0L1J9C0_ASPN3|nr:uncharacterized protein ANOM_003601 [Aspergillus nomiae NRRL 13137]KNG88344.1 hypothetical protein ANOM_003601 [Aspergillus nomiae NRRL 13137]